MKKTLVIVLALAMMLTCAACGAQAKAAPAEVYTAEVDWLEAGYEGDCISTNRLVLVLNSDGTYNLEDGFFVNQVSGVIVFYNKTMYKGTYTAGTADAEGVKTITLNTPTDGYQNVSGVVTTALENAELLSTWNTELGTISVNTTMGVITSEVPQHS